MGWEQRTATPAELDRMRELVAEGMQDGAFGVSTGLTYPPNEWSDTDEMVALCEVAARYGGIYMTHMRGHGDGLIAPIQESIEIARRAGLPLHFSHLKSSRLGSQRNLDGVRKLLADLVAFDPQTVTENATSEEPRRLASGFSYVAVNGTLVLDEGRHTGATPGQALHHF